jgi:hypothetical protein
MFRPIKRYTAGEAVKTFYTKLNTLVTPYIFMRLRVFENRVLRRIFRPKRDEVTGDWRKLHNEELHQLYSSPNIIRRIKQGM